MQLLLCAATEMEIASTVKFLQTNNLPANVLVTGVGLPAAMYALTKNLCIKKTDFIVQAGIAGGINPHFSPGDVVVVESDSLGDVGVQEKDGFHSVFDMGFADKNTHPWSDGKLTNTSKEYRQAGLPIVDAVTVNEVTTSPERIRYYQTQLGAAIESMEGAALHYAGLMENIPFLQIRSISNFTGERDKSKWDLHGAITNLNDELQRLFTNYFLA